MPSPIEVVTIDVDIIVSSLFTVGSAFIVLFGFILKLVERNIINKINACHDGLADNDVNLKEYSKETRRLVNDSQNKMAEHIEKHHTKD